jgi:hypothetical protein
VAQQNGGPYWDGSTAIYTTKTGWHMVFVNVLMNPNDWSNIYCAIGVNGAVNYAIYGVVHLISSNTGEQYLAYARPCWVGAGTYFQTLYYKATGSGNPTIMGSCNMAVVELPSL